MAKQKSLRVQPKKTTTKKVRATESYVDPRWVFQIIGNGLEPGSLAYGKYPHARLNRTDWNIFQWASLPGDSTD